MQLTLIDFAIVILFFIVSAIIGLIYSKRASRSPTEYFSAGRSLPWWLAGTSMVATTFAADTPLAVTALVANYGISGNWLWWNMVAGGLLTVFFFARLWHRAGVQTDAELVELRYDGKPAAFLRGFRAVYLAVPINLIVMGWVNLAMKKILAATFGVQPFVAMLGLFVLTGVYSTLSGLWGVVITDFFQFIMAMTGCVVLAIFAVDAAGGMHPLMNRVATIFPSADAALSFFPKNGGWMRWDVLAIYLTVQWWASWYPGAEPGGGGYVAQRIFSCRNERDGILATLWFNMAHYALRPWPWIVAALAALILFPNPTDPGSSYIQATVSLLPPGVRGLLIASFAAAYMSTISTQLNWGASYLVGDLYVRFVNPTASPTRAVRVSRWATILLFLLSIASTYGLSKLGSVEKAWQLLLAISAGTGLVSLLRWYWWRINAWSEISAMGASIFCFVVFTTWFGFDPTDFRSNAYLILWTTVVTTVVWFAVTWMTPPVNVATLKKFYLKTRPQGWGWRHFADLHQLPWQPIAIANVLAWICGTIAVYAVLFGVGKLLFFETLEGSIYLAAGVASFWVVTQLIRFDDTKSRAN